MENTPTPIPETSNNRKLTRSDKRKLLGFAVSILQIVLMVYFAYNFYQDRKTIEQQNEIITLQRKNLDLYRAYIGANPANLVPLEKPINGATHRIQIITSSGDTLDLGNAQVNKPTNHYIVNGDTLTEKEFLNLDSAGLFKKKQKPGEFKLTSLSHAERTMRGDCKMCNDTAKMCNMDGIVY